MATTASSVESTLPDQSGNQSVATTGESSQVSVPTDGSNKGVTGFLAQVPGLSPLLDQPAVKKAAPAILGGVVILLFAGIFFWLQEPVYRTLYPGMIESDRQAAFEALLAQDFAPRINTTSGQLEVPSGRYHEARILLSSQGLPAGGNVTGFESLNQDTSMTTSQFMEQVKYTAAKEQELAKSIIQISSIQHARVHLAVPKQSVFVRDRTPPKASVVVTPFAGRIVSKAQVQAIINLVSAGVPYLANENVSVVDNYGTLLTDSTLDSGLGLTSAQLAYKHEIEKTYASRIKNLLSPSLGENSVRTQVDVLLDFTETESTFEQYDPDKTGTKTRSEVLAYDREATGAAEGIPGALSNEPPPEAEFVPGQGAAVGESVSRDETSTKSERTTRNYELDRTIRTVKSPVGRIDRVSVAVAINRWAPGAKPTAIEGEPALEPGPFDDIAMVSQNDIDQMKSLIQGVVNFDANRGDSVTIMPSPFERQPVQETLQPWFENEMLLNGVKSIFAILAFIVIVFVVVRPVLYTMMGIDLNNKVPAGATDAAAQGLDGLEEEFEIDGIAIEEGESLEDIKARLKPKKRAISGDLLDTANTYDDKVALLRMLVNEDSARVANVLKTYIKAN